MFYLEDLTSTYDAMSSGEEWIGTDAEAAAEILHSKIQRVQQMEQHLNSICVLLNQQYEAYKEAEEYRRKQF